MGKNWAAYGIEGSGHLGDPGVDIGTPNDTPLFFPFDGKVVIKRWDSAGGLLGVQVPGTSYIQYFEHMDQIYVNEGDAIRAGQIVGTSGGGIGDLVRHNGKIQPAQAQSWFNGYSTGYHTEYGIFYSPGGAATFDAGWKNRALQLDPTNVVKAVAAGQTPSWPGTSGGASPNSILGQADATTAQDSCPETHWYLPWTYAQNAICQGSNQVMAIVQQVMLFLLGLALVIVGFWLLMGGSNNSSDAIEDVAKAISADEGKSQGQATTVAKVAEVAA